MSEAHTNQVFVVKNGKTGQYLKGNNYNFVDEFYDATKHKKEKSAVDILRRWGQKGFEWYPEWAAEAEEESYKHRLLNEAAELRQLFDDCYIECYEQNFTHIEDKKLQSKCEVETKRRWVFDYNPNEK